MAEAVKMAEGPTTVISDYEWLVQNARRGTPQATRTSSNPWTRTTL